MLLRWAGEIVGGPVATYAESIGNAIDVVEPGGDERDLEDAAIVEADFAQVRDVVARTLRGVLCELHNVVEHPAVLLRKRRLRVVVAQLRNEGFVQRDATQKLCVRLDSIKAAVGDRHHGGDHFVLATLEREVGRHQSAERREGVKEDLRQQRVRAYDALGDVAGAKDGRGVFLRVERTLRFDGFNELLARFGHGNRFDPGHDVPRRACRHSNRGIASKVGRL